MKIEKRGQTIFVSHCQEFGADLAKAMRDECCRTLGDEVRNIEIDLSEAIHVDSTGLGALYHLHKAALRHQGSLRILCPSPQAQQLLELTRLHHILEIISEEELGQEDTSAQA